MNKKMFNTAFPACLVLIATVACSSTSSTTENTTSGQTKTASSETSTEKPQRDEGVFKNQENLILGLQGANILTKKTGKGSVDLKIDVGDQNYSQIGFSINCTGPSQWNVALEQKTEAYSQAPCSLQNTPLVYFYVDQNASSQIIHLKNDANSEYWITVFSKGK